MSNKKLFKRRKNGFLVMKTVFLWGKSYYKRAFDSFAFFLVSRLIQQGEHILLISLDTRLIEKDSHLTYNH